MFFDILRVHIEIFRSGFKGVGKMEKFKFLQKFNLQWIIKCFSLTYMITAILAIPVGICSIQGEPPDVDAFFSTAAIQTADHWMWHETAVDWASMDYGAVAVGVEPEPQQTLPFYDHILQASQTYDVDAALIRAIIMVESSNNPRAVSHRGAQGLMQLMPTTAKWLGVEDSFDPALNIDGGVRYFKRLLNRFNGDVQLALAAYNAGSRYVHKYGGVPPFKATRAYIKKVLKYHRHFRSAMAGDVIGLRTS